ncbi:MAG: cyclase family protein [Betaproteobacteria bacterium]|nr:cyclase family protein [Betaproteobacteria bacterium]
MHRIQGIALVVGTFAALSAQAQSWSPPPADKRCPSKWGATDERGAANYMNPANVLRASKLIKTGGVIELGHVLSSSMPFFGARRFEIHTKRTSPTLGTNKRMGNEEVVMTELGQVGTQFDMFAHQGIDGELYNCIKSDDIATRNGFTKLGIENIGMLFTRGVLIDVAAAKGVDMLPSGYEITVADLQQALERQGLRLERGDAVLIHSGWGKLWGVDNARYNSNTPGIGAPAGEWLAAREAMLFGADTFAVEVAPNPDKSLSLPVHQIALVINGIFLLENMKLDELAAKKVYEFAFAVQPLKIKGGTGSTVAPVAMY